MYLTSLVLYTMMETKEKKVFFTKSCKGTFMNYESLDIHVKSEQRKQIPKDNKSLEGLFLQRIP